MKTRDEDFFRLTVDVDPAYWTVKSGGVRITINWPSSNDNLDLYVYRAKSDGTRGETVAASAAALPGTQEAVFVPEASGDYVVEVNAATSVNGTGYAGTAALEALPAGPVFDTGLEFEPASIVSAHFLGTEPMVTMERRLDASLPGRVDPNRIFVDWPLTPKFQMGQLSRSTDGGDSFRLLFDTSCPQRSRPTCATGGGGDTITDVDLVDGTLYFADQEGVATNEAVASSTDHGDTFPADRQFTVSNAATVTDRQWLAATNTARIEIGVEGAKRPIKAFLSYHVPFEGQYIQGIDNKGMPISQPVPQISNVIQSGTLRVDATGGPGNGWVYQPYYDSRLRVATAKGADYTNPAAWRSSVVDKNFPPLFPWLDIDPRGNAYLVWSRDGVIYYSFSEIARAENDPRQGGRPGTHWSPKLRLTPPEIGSAVFTEVVAGDPGRIAITYNGTDSFSGAPDDAPANAVWNTYAAVMTNALAKDGPPMMTTGKVSHRPIHSSAICTLGLNCGSADRSLADMIDLGFDEDGRLGVVFSDNNSTFGNLPGTVSGGAYSAERTRPFAHFAKQISGPSILEHVGEVQMPSPPTSSTDARGDSTWPNVSSGTYLPSLDALGLTLSLDGDSVVARVPLASIDHLVMSKDLATYNQTAGVNEGERLQYVVRFSDASDIYHLSMEQTKRGPTRFFGGKLDANDRLTDRDRTLAAGYHSDFPIQGWVEGDELVLRAPLAAFGVREGTPIFSATAFTMAGPLEADETTIFDPMRTVDATPPFDTLLAHPVEPSPEPSQSQPPELTLEIAGEEAKARPNGETTISAHVLGAEGQPVEGAAVRWTSEGVGEVTTASDRSGPDGLVQATLSSNERGDQLVTVTIESCAGERCSDSFVQHWGPESCDVFGTEGNDVLDGTDLGKVVCGFGGSDLILGGAGDDVLRGGSGPDRLYAGEGDDSASGGSGADEIYAGAGSDSLRGGDGSDLLRGRSGADRLFGGRGRDVLDGGSGNDRCARRRGDRTISC